MKISTASNFFDPSIALAMARQKETIRAREKNLSTVANDNIQKRVC
jgi:hypothetical protein